MTLDPRVEAFLVSSKKASGLTWPRDHTLEQRAFCRQQVREALTAADAARPAMSVKDEEMITMLFEELELGTMGVERAIEVLHANFRITPRAKAPPPGEG